MPWVSWPLGDLGATNCRKPKKPSSQEENPEASSGAYCLKAGTIMENRDNSKKKSRIEARGRKKSSLSLFTEPSQWYSMGQHSS